MLGLLTPRVIGWWAFVPSMPAETQLWQEACLFPGLSPDIRFSSSLKQLPSYCRSFRSVIVAK